MLFRNPIRPTVTVLALTAMAACSSSPTASPATTPTLEEWREIVAATPAQSKPGCYEVHHPSTTWVEVPCSTKPARPIPPTPPQLGERGLQPEVVGGTGSDFLLNQPNIQTAQGSFPAIADVTSETNVGNGGTFSLQLNSGLFPDPNCGSVNGGRCAWEQFVYVQSTIQIQYWLVGQTNCPATWSAFQGNCYYFSAAGDFPTQSPGQLSQMVLTGSSSPQTDFVQLVSGTAFSRVVSTPALDLSASGNWSQAEFNVFGDADGSTAVFNGGATLVGMLTATSSPAVTTAPGCSEVTGDLTAESTNLTLVPGLCSPFASPTPGIVFMESNGTPLITPSALALNVTQGDPNGTLISFAPSNAWSGPVNITLANVPSGVAAVPVNTYGTTFRLTAGKTAPLGETTAIATGQGSDTVGHSQSQSWPIRVTVVAPPVCTPLSCAAAGATCGAPGDGCGGSLSCGACPSGYTCGSNYTCLPPSPPLCNPADCTCAPGYYGGGCLTSGTIIGCAPCTPINGGGGKGHCVGTCM